MAKQHEGLIFGATQRIETLPVKHEERVAVVGLALGWCRAGGWGRVFQAGMLAALLATAAGGGKILMSRPIEPIRDVAEWLEEAGGQEAVVLGYGHGREALAVLAPRLVPVDDAGQLERELAKAGERKRTAHLVVGHLNFNRAMLPSGFAVIEDAKRFREVARFDGIEADNHYRIYKAENGGE